MTPLRGREGANFSEDVQSRLSAASIDTVEEVLAVGRMQKAHGGGFLERLGLSPSDLEALESGFRSSAAGATEVQDWNAWEARAYPLASDLPDRPDEVAFAASAGIEERFVTPATTVSLIAQMPPPRDQGGRDACVAFVAVSCLERYMASARQARLDLSEQYVLRSVLSSFGRRTLDGAFSTLTTAGACRGTTWPYSPIEIPGNPAHEPPPAGADAEASTLICRKVQKLPDLPSVRQCLQAGVPVGIGIRVYASWWESVAVRKHGNITLPLPGEPPQAMGHAITLVGFGSDPERGGMFFLVRNSFGGNWGAESPFGPGYGTIPAAYIQAHTVHGAWRITA
jgi:C1A family cysteine protease